MPNCRGLQSEYPGNKRGKMKSSHWVGLLLLGLFGLEVAAGAQERSCPHFSGAIKKRVEQQARWLVSKSLEKQVAQKSIAFGHLIEFAQCHVLETRLLWDEEVTVEGPFFVAEGVPLKSLIARSQETWTMAVVPSEVTGRMPDANLLDITRHNWTLLYRDESGKRRLVAAGKY